jgi:hypothetical protein
MPDEAVIDAVAEEVAPIEGAETSESAETTEGDQPTGDGQELSGAPLWKSIKDSLATADKNTVAQVRKAIYDATEVGKRHPEGLKGIDAVLESVKKLSDDQETPDAVPIEQVIQDTLEERSFWREFDSKFQAGDRAVIAQMVEANPEGFQRLAPDVMNALAVLNPDLYSSLVSKAVAGYFGTEEIQRARWTLDSIIPQTSDDPSVQKLIEAYGIIKQAFNGLSQMAAKPLVLPDPKKTDAPASEPQNQEDATLKLRDIEWNSAIAPTSQSVMVTEAQKVLGSTKLTAQEIESVRAAFKEEINARVDINKPYRNALNAYLKANNKAQYIQRVNSEHRKIIQNSAKRIVSDVLAARKNAPKKEATKPVTTAKLAAEGSIKFERIAGAPQTQGLKVDLAKTPQSMLVKRQAYIIGRKNPVTWGQK